MWCKTYSASIEAPLVADTEISYICGWAGCIRPIYHEGDCVNGMLETVRARRHDATHCCESAQEGCLVAAVHVGSSSSDSSLHAVRFSCVTSLNGSSASSAGLVAVEATPNVEIGMVHRHTVLESPFLCSARSVRRLPHASTIASAIQPAVAEEHVGSNADSRDTDARPVTLTVHGWRQRYALEFGEAPESAEDLLVYALSCGGVIRYTPPQATRRRRPKLPPGENLKIMEIADPCDGPSDPGDVCAICMSEENLGGKSACGACNVATSELGIWRKLPCDHSFHEECLRQLVMMKQKHCCPLCRFDLDAAALH